MRPWLLRPPVDGHRLEERLLGLLALGELGEVRSDACRGARRGRLVVFEDPWHLDSLEELDLVPGARVTIAFFQFGRRPMKRPTRFSLPRTIWRADVERP